MNTRAAPLAWRPFAEADLPALAALAASCLEADGGQPFAASPDFLQKSYPPGPRTQLAFEADRLACAVSLHAMYYNFVRIHQKLGITPAMAAKVTDRIWEMSHPADVVEAFETSRKRAA